MPCQLHIKGIEVQSPNACEYEYSTQFACGSYVLACFVVLSHSGVITILYWIWRSCWEAWDASSTSMTLLHRANYLSHSLFWTPLYKQNSVIYGIKQTPGFWKRSAGVGRARLKSFRANFRAGRGCCTLTGKYIYSCNALSLRFASYTWYIFGIYTLYILVGAFTVPPKLCRLAMK
jgi:hypothetical protein